MPTCMLLQSHKTSLLNSQFHSNPTPAEPYCHKKHLTLQRNRRCLHVGLLSTGLAGNCKLLVDRAQGAGHRSPPAWCIFLLQSGSADNVLLPPSLCDEFSWPGASIQPSENMALGQTPSVNPVTCQLWGQFLRAVKATGKSFSFLILQYSIELLRAGASPRFPSCFLSATLFSRSYMISTVRHGTPKVGWMSGSAIDERRYTRTTRRTSCMG